MTVDRNQAPKQGQKLEQPKQVVQHKGPSYLDNKRSVANINKSVKNVTVIKNNVKIVNQVNIHNTYFQNNYYRGYHDRFGHFDRYWRDYGWHNYYHNYWRWGFYGGFYYPFRPCYDIGLYFWYPSLFWLYVDVVEDDLYYGWYGDYYYAHRFQPFPFVRVYYPTETFRDLAIEVSAQPVEVQDNFRTAMTVLTSSLAQQLANNLQASVSLGDNNVAVTHYDNLQDQAYEMDGMVDSDELNIHVPFKALIDLVNPDQSLVYVPTAVDPSPADLTTLNLINDRVRALGGNPEVADVEADSLASMQQ